MQDNGANQDGLSHEGTRWKYLEQRANSCRKQLYLKGRPFKAFDIYEEILATNENHDEAARAWNLPAEAIQEVIQYCSQNQELLKRESHLDAKRIESIYRINATVRRILRLAAYGVLAMLPVLLVVASRDWILYLVCALLFIVFLRYVKDLPVVGSFWISCFGDNSVFEWLKITIIPVSVLFLGASITSAINSRQAEATVEKSRFDITQKYIELFNPNNQSAKEIKALKQAVYARAPYETQLQRNPNRFSHVNGSYRISSRCYSFPPAAWLSNQTILTLNQLTGLQINSKSKTSQKRHILDLIQKEGLIQVGRNVVSLHLADLSNSNLVLADLRNSCLESVLFSDYAGTPGSRSDFRHAKFDNSDLTGANLKNGNFRGASLIGVDLRGFSSLRNSDLRGVDLTNARIDNSTNLTGAKINTQTLRIVSHKTSRLYNIVCFSSLRSLLRRTFICLDSIDYMDLPKTRLPMECSPTGCQTASLEKLRERGIIVDNSLPVE